MWRHPEYRDNQLIISWEIPGFMNGIPIVGPELITTIALPKAMNLYEYEHWEMTEEGDNFLRARFDLCDEIADRIDAQKKKEVEEANAQH